MPTDQKQTTMADALRAAIKDSGLSYSELARRGKMAESSISRFMQGQRDLTLQVAGRLCLILGLGLTKVGDVLTEPLSAPPPSNRKRPKSRRPPKSAVKRGRGKRVDLQMKKSEPDGADTSSESS